MQQKYPMTVGGHAALEAELKNLKSVERPYIINAISVAREHGDLSENAEYHAAKEKQGFIEGRVQELESKLSLAQVIDTSKMSGDTVKFGAVVKIVNEDTDEVSTYQIVGEDEASVKDGKVSITSPIARAMISKEVGDVFEVTPHIAIGCGRQAIAPLLALKHAHPDTFTVYVQDPRMDTDRFDLVIAPEHDALTGPNVETMIGSPNRITEAEIAGQTLTFANELNALPMPRAAMLIGGTSKTHKLGKPQHDAHMKVARELMAKGYSLLITTSRRTPDWAITDYKLLDSDNDNVWSFHGDGPNP